MDLKNIGIISLGVVIAALLMSVLLVPIVSDATSAEKTIENTGMPFTEAGGDHTIVVTSAGITVDGDTVDESLFPGTFTSYTLVYGEKSFVRWAKGVNVLSVGDSITLRQFTIAENTITISLSDSTVTVSTTASSQTFTADDVLYYISPSGGDYVLALNPYVNDEQTVYAAGDTFYTGTGRPGTMRIWVVWTGELDTITINASGYNASSYTGVTVDDATANITNVDSNLYRYDSVVFEYTATATVDEQDTEWPFTATYTYFLAPAEVSYDNPSYIGSAAAMLAIVPLLVTVGIIMAAVGIFVSRRE